MRRSLELAMSAVEAASAKDVQEPVLLDVSGVCGYTDYIFVLTGRSARQVEAIGEAIELGMKQRGLEAIGCEGRRGGGDWILLDYGDVIVHVFGESARDYYGIEELWIDAEQVPVADLIERLQRVG